MGLAALTTIATSALSSLLYKSCQLQVVTQTVSGETWANTGSPVVCMYEESSPSVQGTLGYEAGGGYGYDVWLLPSQAITSKNRIVVDGMTFQVQEAATVGAPGPLKRVRTRRVT